MWRNEGWRPDRLPDFMEDDFVIRPVDVKWAIKKAKGMCDIWAQGDGY